MKSIYTLNKAFLLFSLLYLITGCNFNTVYDNNEHIENTIWNYSDEKRFDVLIKDTADTYNLGINIRHEGNYEYSNIYFFITTIFPGNKYTKDTVECILADNKGKWVGKGLGDIKSCYFLIKNNMIFPNSGTYSFLVSQGMREDNLNGITDIGIRINKK